MNKTRAAADLGFQTKAIHEGYDASEHFGAVAPPIYMTSTYAFEKTAEAAAVMSGDKPGYIYGRQSSPTQSILEARLAALEGAEAAVATGSGMGAICSALMTVLQAGDELIVHHTMYSTAQSLVSEGLPRFGVKVSVVDLSDPEALARALSDKTKVVYFESPVNPTGELLDIAALAEVAHRQPGVLVMVDSTFASPALQQPLKLGADVVVHSLTKYINGHGDLLGGVVIGAAELMKRMRSIGLKYMTGSTLSPQLCFLVLRGLKTLSLRMQRHGDSALKIAQMLSSHPAVRKVNYPFLASSPDYALAQAQMVHGTGMLSFHLHAGEEGAVQFIDALQLVTRAISLGDAETLVTHPGSFLRARHDFKPEHLLGQEDKYSLIRLSVGLEDTKDLIADIQQALATLK